MSSKVQHRKVSWKKSNSLAGQGKQISESTAAEASETFRVWNHRRASYTEKDLQTSAEISLRFWYNINLHLYRARLHEAWYRRVTGDLYLMEAPEITQCWEILMFWLSSISGFTELHKHSVTSLERPHIKSSITLASTG